MRPKESITQLLASGGITVDGDEPHDIQVKDDRFYRRVLGDGSLGLGESYVDGWWDARAVDETIDRILRAGLREQIAGSPRILFAHLVARLLNLQERARARRNIRSHYERGLDLFQAMLDERMVYSCGYWKHASTLSEAQEAKLDLVCRKVGLGPGKTLLDIGCGWGSLARYAAERYGANVLGITLSQEQAAVAAAACAHVPVEIVVRDYRDVGGQFDAVVSIGMFEHVGPKNYDAYMEAVDRCLAPGGVSLLHTIGGGRRTQHMDPWLHRHVFSGANLPTLAEIAEAANEYFVIEDVHNIGPDYDRTLMAWHRNFEEAWPRLRNHYDERFRRLWRYYLLVCAGAFRSRDIQVYQAVLTRSGTPHPPCARAS